MKLTKNAKIYGAIGLISSLGFFYLLDSFIASKQWSRIWVIAFIYGLIWCISGLVLGKNDSVRDYRGNLGWMYHVVATVATALAAGFAVVTLDFLSVTDFLWALLAMLASLALHYFGTRGETKGIDKKEAFK